MGVDLRKPPQLAGSDHEQLKQLHSFVFQLVEQLEWALKNVDTSTNTVVVAPTSKSLLSASQPKASAEATFGSIKALIIKSADIVNAYYEEINQRLSSEYLAQSDFGTYFESNAHDIKAKYNKLEQDFTNIQQITTVTGDYVKKVKAHITLGHVDEVNNSPIYGVEVGQTINDGDKDVYNRFARFTSEKLSFYDQNGAEVAYMSSNVLYISNVEIKGSLKEGGYTDFINANGGIVTKWVGGS